MRQTSISMKQIREVYEAAQERHEHYIPTSPTTHVAPRNPGQGGCVSDSIIGEPTRYPAQ